MKKNLFYIITLVFVLLGQICSGQIVISELMSDNSEVFDNELDATPDWLELHNKSNEEVNIGGWFLTDDEDDLAKWEIPPVVLTSDEYLVVLCVGENEIENTSFIQASFKLGAKGEKVFLVNQNGEIMDQINFPCISKNRSFGLNETDDKVHFYVPSPGYENIYSTSFQQQENSISLSHPAGLYENEFDLTVESELSHEIRFTTDGTYPKEEGVLLNGPITIEELFIDDGVSFIPSSNDWVSPMQDVFKGNTLKFITYMNGCPSSEIVHADYFIRENIEETYPLPIYSLTFEEDQFFGDDGILVPGSTGQNYLGDGPEWERRAFFQLLNASEGKLYQSEIDVRVRGRGSRNNSQKSLKLFGRNNEGKAPFDYPFFSESDLSDYRRIVLRSGHSDFTKSMISDVLSSELVENLDVDYMESETSLIFMNGEYWGIQNARENMGKFYLESKYRIDPDAIDLVKVEDNSFVALEGTTNSIDQLFVFSEENNLAEDDNYQFIIDRIELPNFIDYHIAELFFANWDWPQNNQKVWKSHEPNSKFRWLFYDCDGCFYIHSLDRLSRLDFESDDTPFGFTLFRNMLRNENFRKQFHARYLELINNEFSAVNMLHEIDSLEALYEPVILEHINRWSAPDSYTSWKESVSEMRLFALQRSYTTLDQLKKLFGSPISIYPNPSNKNLFIDYGGEEAVYVQILDSRGSLIKEALTTSQSPISVLDLAQGVYLVKVRLGGLVFTEKFIKE